MDASRTFTVEYRQPNQLMMIAGDTVLRELDSADRSEVLTARAGAPNPTTSFPSRSQSAAS